MGVWISGGISGGHINPAVSRPPRSQARSIGLTSIQGHAGACHYPRLPLEEGSCKHPGPSSLASDIDCSMCTISQGYILGQILGGVAGASIIYANYSQALNLVEGGRNVRTELTRGLFATYPVCLCFFAIDCRLFVLNEVFQSAYLSPAGAFFSEFLGTVVLMLMVMAINDKKNCPTPAGLAPLFLFLLVTGLGTSLGMQTGQSTSFSDCLLSSF